MYNRLATEQELDADAASEEELRRIIESAAAPAPAPAPTPAPASEWSPWGEQDYEIRNVDGVLYQPIYRQPVSAETGELPSPIESIWRYKEGQTAPGQTYEMLDPTTGQVTGTGQFKKPGNFFDLLKTAAADLGPILQFTPLAPLVQGVNALSAIQSGNVAQGIASLAGAGQGLGLGDFSQIGNVARAAAAIENKDPLGLLTAGMNLTGTKDIGGFTTKDIAAANAVVQGLQTGNYGQALSGAAQLTDSPNTAVAGAAVSFYDAAKSGNPAAMLRAGEALTGAINQQSRYYSKTDTGDETARLLARYGTADENVIRQIEAMSPRGTTAPGATEDVQEAIFQDVLRQSPTQQVAPAGTEVVQQAIRDDLNRELAEIVYLNADNAGIKTQQEAARVASQRGLPGFIFQGQTFRLGQAPGYLSPEGKLYPSEAAYVATLGPKTITIPGVQIAAPEAGAGRGIAPGATAADAAALARIPLAGQAAAPAAPTESFVNPAVDYTEAGTAIQGQPLPPGYEPTTTLSEIAQNLRDVRQNLANVTNTGGRIGLSQLAGTGLRALELGGRGVGALFGTPEAQQVVSPEEADALTAMQGAPLSPEAQVRDVQKELYDYQQAQFAALPNDAQRAAASGVASTINTVATYALGGAPLMLANAAANTGNLAWIEGKRAGLSDADAGNRAAAMAAIELAGESLGLPFLKTMLRAAPVTGGADALLEYVKKNLVAYAGENATELLTTAGQFAVDKFTKEGIPQNAQDFGAALGNTIVTTIFAFGGGKAVGTFTGSPGLRTVTTQAEPTPIEFLGSTPSTQIVPTEGLPQQLTYQPPAAPPSPVQITGPETAPPAPEVFGPESQLGFEEGVRPTAQQQIEEALSGVYEPPAPPPPAPTAPKDTSGITPEMVAFIDEEGNLVTYGDLGLTSPAPAPAPSKATQTQAEPATEAIFAEPQQMDEINRLFQEVYQQQNYPVATAPVAAPVTAPAVSPAQQNVIDLAPTAPTVAAPAQDLSAIQQAINQTVYGGTGEEPVTRAPVAAPATGTILSTDPEQGTALVVDPNGNTKVVDVAPDSKPGDKVDLAPAPAQDLSTPVATDPATGEVIRLGDVVPSAPSPAPAPSTTETRTQAPAPSQATITTAAPSPAPSTTETKTEAPAPAPTATETKTEAPAPAETKTEVKAPSPAPTITETKTEAPAPAEIKTEAPAPTTETKTEAPAPAPVTTEAKTEAPAPTATETKTEAPAPTTTETKTEAPAPAPPAQPPAPPPSQPPAQPPAPPPARPPAPTPAPPPGKAPPPGQDVLPPVTEEDLREIVAGPPPVTAPPPPAPTPAPPAPTPALPAPTPAVKPPAVKPPSPPPSPAAQLAQIPGMTPELAKFIQELMKTEEADLLQLTTALKQEREEKREGLRGKLKSRKA